jgi:lipoprotein-anchoring transpeptidase ErfK/SrfK
LGSRYLVAPPPATSHTSAKAYSTFTDKPSKVLRASVSPDNRTVGVGMPITVSLSAKPASRAAVERRLTVTTSKPVTGAWHWFDDTSLHWRPKDFWPANTHVTVKAKLKGVKFGKNTYGDHNTNASFDIGKSNINTVDVAAHRMTVTTNGKVLRTIPVTTGNSRLPTRAGIKVIVTKERSVVMDSATVDIPASSPDAYKLTVKNAMRLTWSGEFIHAAPWSVGSQGVANVSHGCTGMSNANAAWMFDHSQIGDVVKYINSSRPLEQGNGYTDWNIPWSQWLAGSALA